MTTIGPSSGLYVPTREIFEYSDHSSVTVDAAKARFLRPLSFQTRENYTPEARVRFRSEAPSLQIRLQFNNLYDRSHWFDIISVYVDHVWHSDHNPTDSRTVFDYNINLSSLGAVDFRTIEVVFPYCAGVDFKGISQDPRYRIEKCTPRPAAKLLAIGDSITNGFEVTQSRNGYAFLLARLIGRQCINMGYANAIMSTHGSAAYAALMSGVDRVTVMLGINDCAAQTPLTTFGDATTTLLNGLLADTSAQIFVITPIWTSLTGTIPISSYRTTIADVVTAIGNARLTLVNGLTLCTNSTAHVPDGVHLNDAGAAACSSNLAAIEGMA